MSIDSLKLWEQSASAWIHVQGEGGDMSRREILDPCIKPLLGDLNGLEVLDLGCGEGRFSRWMSSQGANVSGIDPVNEFIQIARQKDPLTSYDIGFAEELPYADHQFDIVLSYLTLIDIPDIEKAAEEVNRVLKPGGRFVAAIVSNLCSMDYGWVKDENGNRLYRKVDNYMEHSQLVHEWKGIRIVNFHRPLSFILNCFFKHGMVMTKFIEPIPIHPGAFQEEESRVPNFQVFEMRK